MKKLFVFASVFIFFACGNPTQKKETKETEQPAEQVETTQTTEIETTTNEETGTDSGIDSQQGIEECLYTGTIGEEAVVLYLRNETSDVAVSTEQHGWYTYINEKAMRKYFFTGSFHKKMGREYIWEVRLKEGLPPIQTFTLDFEFKGMLKDEETGTSQTVNLKKSDPKYTDLQKFVSKDMGTTEYLYFASDGEFFYSSATKPKIQPLYTRNMDMVTLEYSVNFLTSVDKIYKLKRILDDNGKTKKVICINPDGTKQTFVKP